MAAGRLFNQGMWTWFNEPRAIYDHASHSSYAGWMAREATSTAAIWIGQYRHDHEHWDVYKLATGFALDDHNDPAVLPLASGKILAAWSQHNGTSFSRLSSSAGSIQEWDSVVSVNDGVSYDDAYVHLAQTADDNDTIWWFCRRNDGDWLGNWYRVSTDGITWATPVQLFASGTDRPYMRIWHAGNRIDVATTDGHPDEVATNSVYHFYLVIDSSGDWFTLYQSDGTSIGAYDLDGSAHTGSPPSLPIGPDDVTQIYDGTSAAAWVQDIAIVAGTLQVLYTVYTTDTDTHDTHTHHRATLSGGAWSSESVCNGGPTLPNWIYPDSSTSEEQYSGGICLDPATPDRVYVARKHAATSTVISRGGNITLGSAVVTGISTTGDLSAGMSAGRFELPGGAEILTVDSGTQVTLTEASNKTTSAAPIEYQSADVRIEQWDKSGSWSLTSTVYNNGQTNARPFVVRHAPTPMVLWWSGVYGSYTDFYAGVFQSDVYTTYTTKPETPTYTAAVAPVGTRAYWLIYEGSGSTLNDLTGSYDGTIVGSPTWGSDAVGPNLTGLSTSNYVTADAIAADIATQMSGNLPIWYAVLAKNSSTTAGVYAMGGASSATNNTIWGLSFNNGATNTIKFFSRNDANSDQSITVAGETRINDGNWHLYAWLRSGSGSNQTVAYLDGQQIGTATTSGTLTPTAFTLGCLRRASVVSNTGFNGTLGAVLVGWGAIPDFTALYLDLASYQFGGTQEPIETVSTYTLTGPSSGTVGVASTAFTVELGDGTLFGSAVITPADASDGGTFTPTSVTLTDSTRSDTFTYAAASSGSKSISTSDDIGLTDPSPVAFTASDGGDPPPTPALNVAPTRGRPSGDTIVIFTGIETEWLSDEPTFTPTGVSGVSIGSVVIVSDTQATAVVTADTSTGTVTITDSTTDASTLFVVANRTARCPGSFF